MNEVSLFSAPLPAHVKAKSKAMQAMGGGMAGAGVGNRISIRGNRFRFVQGGVEVGVHNELQLDVVVFALAESVQRLYYANSYEADTKTAPDCWSHDGKVPSNDSTAKQASSCAICPQNVKGSARQGNGKACAYKKRIVVLAPDDLDGTAWSHDVNGQSMFGEQDPAQNLFSFKGYFEKLTAHGVAIDAIVTRVTFDGNASVPKLHFSPVRALTEEEYAVIQARAEDPEVAKMLKDLTNETEVEAFEQLKKDQPKAAAPEPAKQIEVKPKGVGGLVSDAPKKTKGFGAAPSKVAEVPAAVVAPKKGITVDLEQLTNFDD